MQALYEELLKFSSQDDVELLRKTMGQEIKKVQEQKKGKTLKSYMYKGYSGV